LFIPSKLSTLNIRHRIETDATVAIVSDMNMEKPTRRCNVVALPEKTTTTGTIVDIFSKKRVYSSNLAARKDTLQQ
jgi:hypothetical protein